MSIASTQLFKGLSAQSMIKPFVKIGYQTRNFETKYSEKIAFKALDKIYQNYCPARAIKAVICDWAGTTMDYGVYSPVVAFQKVFELNGIPITVQEARAPMGKHKKVHIGEILKLESVRERFIKTLGRNPSSVDVDKMFDEFVGIQEACIPGYAKMIHGTSYITAEIIQKKMGLSIGSTTGFTRSMQKLFEIAANENGYFPDVSVTADEVPYARPFGYMVARNMHVLDALDPRTVVKFGDTEDDMREGKAVEKIFGRSVWCVGVSATGNYVGKSEEEINCTQGTELLLENGMAAAKLYGAGADMVVSTIWELPAALRVIDEMVVAGQKPRKASKELLNRLEQFEQLN